MLASIKLLKEIFILRVVVAFAFVSDVVVVVAVVVE
jgi:hypothetical protein